MDSIKSKPAPELELPSSTKTVRVRAIDTTTRMACDAYAFVQPQIQGHEKLNFKTMCFLIEHEGEHILFDCGSRKDFWNGSPHTQSMIGGHVPAVEIEYGVDEILTMQGFGLQDLSMALLLSRLSSRWRTDADDRQRPSSGATGTGTISVTDPSSRLGLTLLLDLDSPRISSPVGQRIPRVQYSQATYSKPISYSGHRLSANLVPHAEATVFTNQSFH